MSSDDTVDIARQYTGSVFQRSWTGYEDQKNFALSTACGNWVLSLDADEEITPVLREEILTEIDKAAAKNGYRMPRRSFYQGRWINHSGFYPDRQYLRNSLWPKNDYPNTVSSLSCETY